MAAVMAGIYTTTRLGLGAQVTDEVQRLLGRPPISFRQFAEENRAVWLPDRNSTGASENVRRNTVAHPANETTQLQSRRHSGVAPPNTLGLRSVMFTVESIDDTVARLRATGAELIGEVAQYEDLYKLCCLRGPAGIIVAWPGLGGPLRNSEELF